MNTAEAYDLLGTPVSLQLCDGEISHEVTRLLSGLDVVKTRGARRLELRDDGGHLLLLEDDHLVRAGMGRREAVTLILWRLNRIAASSSTHVVVHAGTVTLEGRAVVLAGRMNAGKSTLVAALARDNFVVLSDEHAPLRLNDSHVDPYPLPIQLDERSLAVLGLAPPPAPPWGHDPDRVRILPAEIGQGLAPTAAPPALVVFPEHCPLKDGTPERVRRPEALRRLAEQALNLQRLGPVAMDALARLVVWAPAYRLEFDDLAVACKALRRLLAKSEERYVERPMPRAAAGPIVKGQDARDARLVKGRK